MFYLAFSMLTWLFKTIWKQRFEIYMKKSSFQKVEATTRILDAIIKYLSKLRMHKFKLCSLTMEIIFQKFFISLTLTSRKWQAVLWLMAYSYPVIHCWSSLNWIKPSCALYAHVLVLFVCHLIYLFIYS